ALVGGEDGLDRCVEVIPVGERVEPGVDRIGDALLPHHVARWMVRYRRFRVVGPGRGAPVVRLVLGRIAEHRLATVSATNGASEEVAPWLGTWAADSSVASRVRDAIVHPAPQVVGDERGRALLLRPRPRARLLPPLARRRAECGIAGIDEFVVAPLAA